MSQSRKRRRPVRVSLYDYEPRTSESSIMKPKRSRKSDPIGYRSTVSSQAPFIPQNRIEDVTNYKTVPDNKTRRTEKDGNSLESLRKRKEEKQKHFEKHTENQQIPPHQQHSDIHQQDQASNKQPSGPSGQQSMTEQKQTKQQQNGENVNQKAGQGAVKKVNGVDQIGKARNNRNINMRERSTDHHSRRVISMSKLDREEEDERKYETNQEDEVRMQHTANNQEVEAAIRQQQFQSTAIKRIETASHMAYHKQIYDSPRMIEDENTLNQTENGSRAYTSRVQDADRIASPKVDQVDVMRLFSTQVEMMNIITKTTTRNEELQQIIRDLLRKDNEKDVKIKDLEISFNEKIEEERRNSAKIAETSAKCYNDLILEFDIIKQDKDTKKGVDESIAKAVHDAKEQVKLQELRNDSFIISTISHLEKVDKNIENLLASNLNEVQRKEKGSEINSSVIGKQDALRDDFKSRLDRHNLEIRRIDQTIVSQNESLKKRVEDLTMREQKREENDKLFRQAIDAFVTSSSRFAQDVEGVKRGMAQVQTQVSDLIYKDNYLNDRLSSIVSKVDNTSSSQSRQNDYLKNQITTHSRELKRLMLERASDADMSLKDVRDKIEFLKGRVIALDKVVNDSLRNITIHPAYEINSIRTVSEDGM
ncbi:hypothetical protein WALSEDRAFT_58974 [Wallemia mellicola CBS 633.66]|uniref:Uncharacterized protein n=1 Tax=Wallemia mellicola (strain ATCC MYA-4683 / CBS 633.66) TaxID=671144 RepID=I4YIR2_WALMC|nr:hypothetical protein WALSEDRAFT_58974 [Wallemia mellicola CBS 633.66]EIM23854.1 hypothetical protein WALSEDRAFT_58974 [Wallemia mellicola CBS 633.66]|eukprot:XP_006955700.1 hypothetical protein WALSEDRAFT_58974 [Wallemia mellicola CBS 633.66]